MAPGVIGLGRLPLVGCSLAEDNETAAEEDTWRVGITGGSGYVGRATIRALQRHGHQAVALARSDDADRCVTALGATVVRGGLTDLDVLAKTALDVDAAIQLAQDYGPDTAHTDLQAATAMQDGLGSRPHLHTRVARTHVHSDTTLPEP